MINKHLHLLTNKIIACLLLFLTACQGNTTYHAYQPISTEGWYRHDTLTYYFNSSLAKESIKKIQIGIRHTDSYHYQDLWIGILSIKKDSITTKKTDSLHLFLAENGVWQGTGIGETRQFTHEQTISQKTDSILGVKVFHLMKDQPLKGINHVGICIKKP